MKVSLAFLTFLLIVPGVGAGFINSNLTIEGQNPSAIGLDESESTTVVINYSWGFGNLIPIPVTVVISAENIPDWATVSISPETLSFTPTGIKSGKVSSSVTVSFHSYKEVPAFISEDVILKALTNGNFILKGAEATKSLSIQADFVDKKILVGFPTLVNMYAGEEKSITFNITNKCNARITVEIAEENVSDLSFIYDTTRIEIPSQETKSIVMKIKADKAQQVTPGITFTYYPIGYPQRTFTQTEYLTITSENRSGTGGGALAIGLVIVVIAVILFVIWRKWRKTR